MWCQNWRTYYDMSHLLRKKSFTHKICLNILSHKFHFCDKLAITLNISGNCSINLVNLVYINSFSIHKQARKLSATSKARDSPPPLRDSGGGVRLAGCPHSFFFGGGGAWVGWSFHSLPCQVTCRRSVCRQWEGYLSEPHAILLPLFSHWALLICCCKWLLCSLLSQLSGLGIGVDSFWQETMPVCLPPLLVELP